MSSFDNSEPEDLQDNGETFADPGDIELAYRQALEALDAAEEEVGSALMELASDDEESDQSGEEVASGVSIGDQLARELSETDAAAESSANAVLVEGVRRVTPREVVEAALFVGGENPLTARRLASLIGENVDQRVAVSLIDAINQGYAKEKRPYEIRLHEGGFRMELRENAAMLMTRSATEIQRDVHLSPDALEVLAFVAWNQPVSQQDLATIDKPTVSARLRQLIRLQLVALKRTGVRRSDVAYTTTPEFLRLFGLESLEDLPTADLFAVK